MITSFTLYINYKTEELIKTGYGTLMGTYACLVFPFSTGCLEPLSIGTKLLAKKGLGISQRFLKKNGGRYKHQTLRSWVAKTGTIMEGPCNGARSLPYATAYRLTS